MSGPLSGIRVVEIALAGVGPWSCTLLSEMGAEIIKVGEGDVERGPMPTKNGTSSMYLASNLGKTVARFDLHDEVVRETMFELVRQSDILIENHRPGYLDRRGLSYEAVSKINPRMIYCSSSGYGSYGPYAQMGSSDSYGQAIGGFASVSGPVGGIPEGMKGTSPLDHGASQNIVVGVLAALYNREITGRGQLVDTSQMHAAVGISGPRAAEYFASGTSPGPMGSGTATIVPSRAFKGVDGKWMNLSALDEPTWQRLCAALGLPGLASDRRLQSNAGRVAHRAEVDGAIEAVIATQPAEHWIAALLAAGLPAGGYLNMNNLRINEQVRHQEMIKDLDTPWGRITVGGMPWKFSRTPGEIRPPVRAGTGNDEVMTRFAPPETAPAPVAVAPAPARTGPLDGLQVVDMTQGYVGYCGMVMADLGAAVVKVEPAGGDSMRLQGPPFIGDTAAAFAGVNRSKRSIQLAWETDPTSREALERLIARADILITDLQPTAARARGLDHASLEAKYPRLVHCSITPFGDGGPMADQPATDLEVQGISGAWQWMGEWGGEPVRMGIPIGPMYAAIFAVHGSLAAMHERTKSGKGQLVSVSQMGSQTAFESTVWVSESEPDEWGGHCNLRFGPPAQGYPTKDDTRILWGLGNDQAALRAFYDKIGIKETRPPGGIDAKVDPVVAEAFAHFPADQLIQWVRELGGSAVPVYTFETLQQDPQAIAMGLVSEYEYPGVGKVGTTGIAWEFSETPAKHGRPPLLGEHTEQVLQGLGFVPDAIGAMRRAAH